MSRWGWRPYVPVAARQAKAKREMEKLRKKGTCIQPVVIEGRTIARSFWGKGWCDHLESFSDYENRLPRGRTYVRNGSVCHLGVAPGRIDATVSGSELYKITITVAKLDTAKWSRIKQNCAGQVGSIIELLQGKLSSQVMAVVTEKQQGLFPLPGEIKLNCSCPDWATMCKHVAAVLYGVGSRLDDDPNLLFLLRGVDPQELITQGMALPGKPESKVDSLHEDSLGDIFGIELDEAIDQVHSASPSSGPAPKTTTASPRRKATTKKATTWAAVTTKAKDETATNAKTSAKTVASPSKKTTKPPVAAKGKTTVEPDKPRASKPTKDQSAKTSATPQAAPKPKPFVPKGTSISRLREKSGLTVQDFAARLGVTPASVYRWENSRGRLNLQDRSLSALQRLHEQVESKS